MTPQERRYVLTGDDVGLTIAALRGCALGVRMAEGDPRTADRFEALADRIALQQVDA